MNQERLDETLARLRWSRLAVCQMTGYSDRQMRRWQEVPEPVARWLLRIVKLLDANPPPAPTHGRKPRA